jgi:hypothetical protein
MKKKGQKTKIQNDKDMLNQNDYGPGRFLNYIFYYKNMCGKPFFCFSQNAVFTCLGTLCVNSIQPRELKFFMLVQLISFIKNT